MFQVTVSTEGRGPLPRAHRSREAPASAWALPGVTIAQAIEAWDPPQAVVGISPLASPGLTDLNSTQGEMSNA